MKHPGLQHQMRLEEALNAFFNAKTAWWGKKAQFKEANDRFERASNEVRESRTNYENARGNLTALMDADRITEDGVPFVPGPAPGEGPAK